MWEHGMFIQVLLHKKHSIEEKTHSNKHLTSYIAVNKNIKTRAISSSKSNP